MGSGNSRSGVDHRCGSRWVRGGSSVGRRLIVRGVGCLAAASMVSILPTAMMPAGAVGGVASPNAGGAGEPPHALSSDGTVVLANDQIDGLEALVRFEVGEAPVSLGSAAVEVAVSADGAVAASIDASQALRVVDASGSSIVTIPVSQPIVNLVMSGDGRFLSFAARTNDSPGLVVHRFDRVTRQLIALPADAGVVTRPIDMSDDGRRVLVWRGSEPDVGQLGVFDVEALTFTKVTVDPVTIIDAALAPDGSSVLFASTSAIVGGVGVGVHLYETTLDDRLIKLIPVGMELNESVEIAATGQVLAQRSATNPRLIELFDRRSGSRSSKTVAGTTAATRLTPLQISDDSSTLLVHRENCVAGVCTAQPALLSVATGVADPLSLRWSEADRPLFDSLDRLYLAVTGRPADAGGHAYWISRLVAGDSLESVAGALLDSTEGSARFPGELNSEAVVGQALSGVLGRTGTGEEIAAVVATAGSKRPAALVVAASASAEAVVATATSPPQSGDAGQLIRLYRAVFGRFPDQLGYRYWAGQQLDGLSLDAMIDSFAVSAEYEQRFGRNQSDDQLIAQLYRNVLGRNPDADGANYWRQVLADGAGRNVMLHAFVDSAENIRLTGTQP